MNIFVTHPDQSVCAIELDDIRLTKMVLETAQLLSTAARMHGADDAVLYRKTHVNHPCAVWVRENRGNYKWALTLMACYCDEFRARRGKSHASESLLPTLALAVIRLPTGNLTPFVNCARRADMGLDFTGVADVHDAYRQYLTARWALDRRPPTWGRRGAPGWYVAAYHAP